MASCKSCGAEIDWAVDTAGKRIPVDQGEREDGNVAVFRPADNSGLIARYLKHGEQLIDERRTVSHFATCPQAEKWRERGRG